jgi:DNA-binding IclR family transcriptional regulator
MSQAVVNALRVLEALAEAGLEGLTQAVLAAQVQTSEATVSRLVDTLEAEGGYVERTARGLRLGKKVVWLWKSYRVMRKADGVAVERDLRETALEEEVEG